MPDAQRAEIAKLESLHADHPEGRIFTHLAEAYRKAGELERAREVLAEGIERHPDYSSAHVVLARVLVDQGESAEAEAEFRRVLQLDSHNLVALRSLGDLALAAGRTDQALDLYRRLLEIEPSDEDVRVAIREIEEGPAAPVGTPESPDEAEDGEDSPWASDIEDAGAVPGEEEAWTVDGTGDEEDSSTEVAWSPGEDHADPEPPRMEDAVVEEAALDDVGAADAEVLDDHADALSEPAAADDLGPGPDVGEPGMLTETIAQVYARQGLYDRAAEVYRQLLRVRPDDDGLRTRMEEMEALAAAPGEPADEPGLASEPEMEPEMEPPVGLPPLEPERPDPDVERLPGLETTEPEAVPHVAPLGGLETDEIDPDTGLRTDEPSWQDWSEPSAPEADMVPSRDYAAEDYEAEDHEPQDHEPQDHEPESVESVWTGAGGASGAEESPYAWAETEAEPEEDSSEPIDRYLRSLLGWAGGAGAAAADAEAETEDTTEPVDTAPPADTADTDNPPTEGAADRGDGGESPDDDDLDTFRSWLESLKQ